MKVRENLDKSARAAVARDGLYALVAWSVWVIARSPMPREVARLGALRSAMPEVIRGREGYGWDDARAPVVRPEGWQLDLAMEVVRVLVALPAYDRELIARKGDRSRPARDIARKHGDLRSARSITTRRRQAADRCAQDLGAALGKGCAWRLLLAARDLDNDATAEDTMRAAWEESHRATGGTPQRGGG